MEASCKDFGSRVQVIITTLPAHKLVDHHLYTHEVLMITKILKIYLIQIETVLYCTSSLFYAQLS